MLDVSAFEASAHAAAERGRENNESERKERLVQSLGREKSGLETVGREDDADIGSPTFRWWRER